MNCPMWRLKWQKTAAPISATTAIETNLPAPQEGKYFSSVSYWRKYPPKYTLIDKLPVMNIIEKSHESLMWVMSGYCKLPMSGVIGESFAGNAWKRSTAFNRNRHNSDLDLKSACSMDDLNPSFSSMASTTSIWGHANLAESRLRRDRDQERGDDKGRGSKHGTGWSTKRDGQC